MSDKYGLTGIKVGNFILVSKKDFPCPSVAMLVKRILADSRHVRQRGYPNLYISISRHPVDTQMLIVKRIS